MRSAIGQRRAALVGIITVFRLAAWLPALGLLTFLLPAQARS